MLLRHVLPKRFRRAVVQLLLHVMLPEPRPAQPRPPIYCPLCGGVMDIVEVRVRESKPGPGRSAYSKRENRPQPVAAQDNRGQFAIGMDWSSAAAPLHCLQRQQGTHQLHP